MTTVWWIRRDARLLDNPALLAAQAEGPAAAIFAWTTAVHLWSGRRRAHLARVLWSLREDTGRAVGVRHGAAADVVLGVAREHEARMVVAAREFSPAGVREQDAVGAALAADGRALLLVGSPYGVEPGGVRKSDGSEYRVFTPFLHAWREHGWDGPARSAVPGGFARVTSTVDVDQEAARGDTEDPLAQPHEFRETRVLERLEAYVESGIERYASERDRPDLDSTSRLSVPLAYGQLHVRTALAATRIVPGESARKLESELAWREFHADVLHHHPRAQRESLAPALPDDSWAIGPEADAAFMAWRDGRTGFPLVDAGMRELAATGTMHNRVRMVVASFLVKDLHLPWQRGAAHFRRALVDYDHAQNQLNWQWVAGTGRDAAPFFRVFNPAAQADRFDPHRRYVERWVPELDTPAYPPPMVDHATERAVALAALKAAKSSRTA